MGIKKLRAESRELYNNVVSVECPILGAKVQFRPSGFFHLINETSSKPHKAVRRKIGEQYMKLKCLPHAPYVLKNCEKVSEVRVVRKKNSKGKWQKVKQHELACEVSPGVKIRVVVEENSLGEYYFASVMPHDKASKQKSTKKRPGGRP